MDPGIRQDFWAPAYRRGDAGFGDYGLLKFRCVYRALSQFNNSGSPSPGQARGQAQREACPRESGG